MSLLKSLRLVLAPPHRAGRLFLIGSLGTLVAGWLLGRHFRWLRRLALLFGGFCLYFFRDPARVTPVAPGLVVAPADGRIVSIELVPPPPELGLGTEPRWRIGIFLSVLDVHVNRMPVSATISRVVYHRGLFLNASLDKASEQNERNALALALDDGRSMAVVQIAGLIARRILCDARAGDRFERGERFGLIRFGSRTDLYLPPGVQPQALVGQKAVGGETVLAHL